MLLRIFGLALTLLVIFAATRLLIRGLPGDPIETLLAETGTAIPAEQLREELGLDVPPLATVLRDLGRVLQGDFGRSIHTRQPIGPLLAERALRTALVAVLALALALLIGLALGLPPALKNACDRYAALTTSIPSSWLGPMLALALAVKIPVFKLNGGIGLPVLTLGILLGGGWARLIRLRVAETLAVGSAQAARARGTPENLVILKHGLAPALGALLAILGTQTGLLLTGSFVVEVLFDWPGLGSLLVESVLRRDYPVVEAAVFIGAAASLTGTFLGDWARALWDPRQRGESA